VPRASCVADVSLDGLDEVATGGGGQVTLEVAGLLIFLICAKAGSAATLLSAAKIMEKVSEFRIEKIVQYKQGVSDGPV
jgi:hypothetical protein